MKKWNDLIDDESNFIQKPKSRIVYSDNIYTFDCETTSMFFIDGKWQKFDYNRDPNFYKTTEKRACVWIWQFGINDEYYYGRTPEEFGELLEKISNPIQRKIIYVFNLPFEFQQFLYILKKYKITRMIAREIRKPISFLLEDLNIEFRCLYALTGLSLENASKKYTKVEKAVGDLDYEKIRSPLTKNITPQEWHYIEYDLVCMYEILKYFKEKYKYIYRIPYTQTGEVRTAFRETVPYWYIQKMKRLVPTVKMFKLLWAGFMGGYTHPNMLHANETLKEVQHHKDETSAYPTTMVLYKFPMEPFREIDLAYFNRYYNNPNYGKLMVIRLENVKPKKYNHIISVSKCVRTSNVLEDNGRVVSADFLEIVCNDIDLELFKTFYKFKLKVKECYISRLERLPKPLINYILDLYEYKTTLKGTPEEDTYNYNLYMQSKQYINAMYGCAVQNVVKSTCDYGRFKETATGKIMEGWNSPELSDEVIQAKLDEQRNGRPLFYFAWGVWVTAYNRRALLTPLGEIDEDVTYSDTDSIIYEGDHDDTFERWNNYIMDEIKKAAEELNIPIERFKPKDKKGIEHPIGLYESEEDHTEGFKTLGAKKYAYIKDGKVKITVSGVRKSAGKYLKNLDEFKDGHVFTYEQSKKLISLYNDEQPPFTFTDEEGNEYNCTQETAIVLQPTTFKIGVDDDWQMLIDETKKLFNKKEGL